MNLKKEIEDRIKKSIECLSQLIKDDIFSIEKVAKLFIDSYKNKKTVYWLGNGGSATDAQHLSCELVNRFYLNRKALPSLAFTENVATLTSVPNDYSFDYLFTRQVEAFVKKGDVVVALSTSGNSLNVVNAVKKAKELKAITVGFTGKNGGLLKNEVDILIRVPSDDTPIVQECHIMIGHLVCYIVEKELFGEKK